MLVIPRKNLAGTARLTFSGQPTEIVRNLLELLEKSKLWQHSPVDPIQIKAGMEVINRLAMASMPALSDIEKASLREVQDLCERSMRGELTESMPSSRVPQSKGRDFSQKDLEKVTLLTPEEFFVWFDGQLQERGREELRLMFTDWVKMQEGKHEFSDLPAEQAMASKHSIARGIQSRLDEIGLAILCQHVSRQSGETCGKIGRLNAELTGGSRSGQFLVKHNSSNGGRGTHMRKTSFPRLTLCNLLRGS